MVKKIFTIFFVMMGTINFFPATVHSADKNSMDVVLVIDSSGSMKKTDPLSLRIPAAKLFISLLDKNDRAGVISFSERSSPIIQLTPVDSEDNKNRLFEATEKITSDGLYTNLHDALRSGLDLLSQDTNADRSKVIILMSDGMMDVGDSEEDKRLVEQSKTVLAVALKQHNISVYTIAFTDQSDKKLLDKISKRTGGFYNLALSDNEFHVIFTSIFESLKTPEMLPMSKNGFLVDNSIEEVTIVATKGTPDTRIQIDSPDGQSYTYKNKNPDIKWFVSNNFDMITVRRPVEGRWEILFSAGENNKAYIITDLKLQTNFDQLNPSFGSPIDVHMWLEKEGSTITEKDLLDKIDMYLELSTPDSRTMKLDPYNNGRGIFNRKIASFTSGNYMLKIVAKGMTFERQKTFVFNIASTKEAKEEITFEASVKEAEHRENAEGQKQPEVREDQEDHKTDEVSWTSFTLRFLIFNIVICIAGFVYFKRKDLKNVNIKNLPDLMKLLSLINVGKMRDLIQQWKDRKKPEEQSTEAAPEESPRQEVINGDARESHEEQKTETAPEEPAPQQDVINKEMPESPEEQKNEISLDDIEPEQEAAGEEALENQGDQKNEISLDDVEPEQEVTNEETQDSQEWKKGELPIDNTELQQDMKEGEPGSA